MWFSLFLFFLFFFFFFFFLDVWCMWSLSIYAVQPTKRPNICSTYDNDGGGGGKKSWWKCFERKINSDYLLILCAECKNNVWNIQIFFWSLNAGCKYTDLFQCACVCVCVVFSLLILSHAVTEISTSYKRLRILVYVFFFFYFSLTLRTHLVLRNWYFHITLSFLFTFDGCIRYLSTSFATTFK